MIEVENLSKTFNGIKAIDGVTFRVDKGEILGFLGPNGAGKTTTMRIVTGYMPATGGSARVAGFDVYEQSLEARRRIGYLPENPPLYHEMTVRSYLRFVSKIKGVGAKQREPGVDDVIEKCRLQDVAHRIIAKLSKGYKQRVGLAQALLGDPEVLVLDEPTIGLDPKQINDVRQLIKGLAGSHTVVLSTHILPEVSMTCNRVVIIDRGKIIAVDTPENLTSKLRGAERIYLEAAGAAEALQKALEGVPGVSKVLAEGQTGEVSRFHVESQLNQDIRRDLASAVVRGGFGLLEMRTVTMSLEEVFIKLVTSEDHSGVQAA